MQASFKYAQSVLDMAYAKTKAALLQHITDDTEEYAAQDELLIKFQSLRAARTAIVNASRQPIASHVNGNKAIAPATVEQDLEKAVNDGIMQDGGVIPSILRPRPEASAAA